MRHRILSLILLWTFLVSLSAVAADPPPPTAWQEVGPNGTSVYSLLFDSDHPGVVFAGVAGGVYRSRDGGASWQQVFVGREDAHTWSLAFGSGVLYAGTSPYGLYESRDAGATWRPLLDGNLVRMSQVVVDPARPRTVYSLQDGSLKKTTDGAIHWSSLDAHRPAGDPVAIAVDGGSPSVVYLSTATPAKTWRSLDGGLTWTAAGSPLNTAFQALAVDPVTHKTYAGTSGAGLLVSADRGLTWKPVPGFPAGLAVTALASRGKLLYAGTATPAPEWAHRGLIASLDGGVSWHPSHTGLEDLWVFTLAIDPHRTGVALAGIESLGLLKTGSSGGAWALSARGMAQLDASSVAQDPIHSGTLYVGTNWRGLWKSVDGAHTWTWLGRAFNGFEIRELAVDPRQPGTLYAGNSFHSEHPLLLRSRDGGVTASPLAQDLPQLSGTFLIDPGHPFILYLGTLQGLYRSTDRGSTWTGPAAGLECFVPLALTISMNGTVFAGGLVPRSCGSGGGKILASTDSGATWEERSATFSAVMALIADPVTPTTLYAGSGTQVLRSTDSGSTWQASEPVGGIAFVESLALVPGTPGTPGSPGHPATVYAGLLGGVFSSTDGGVTWQRVGILVNDDFLANSLIYDPAAQRLYAATPWGLLTHPAGVP
jgi:photosystem II stability/assembly factor-like uncharacterized protein